MKRIATLIIMTLLTWGTTQAQLITDNALFYHSFRSPWSNSFNPALFPSQSGGYFTTAKTDVNVNLPLSYSDLGLQYDPQRDVTVLNLNPIIDNLIDNGCRGAVNADVNILGCGFTVKEAVHISASVGVRVDANFNVPTGLLELISRGNINETGIGQIDFGAQNILTTQAYGYASLSAAFKVPVLPLTIGARVNILDGIVTASADNLSVSLTTPEDISSLTLATDYQLHLAGIPTLENLEELKDLDLDNILKNFKFPLNLGFTFDLGAKAKLGIFDLSMSVKDLGPGIHWSYNPFTIVPKTRDITLSFDGIDLSTLLTNGRIDTSFISTYKDSLLAMIDYTTEEEDYWYSMPTHLYLGASASLGKIFRVGYLFQGLWQNGWFSNHNVSTSPFACNNTLSAHLNLANWLELAVANSFTYDGSNFAFLNPGASITMSFAKKYQIFASIEYASSIYLTELKAAHIIFGINIVGLKK